jgi:hypothetical protein
VLKTEKYQEDAGLLKQRRAHFSGSTASCVYEDVSLRSSVVKGMLMWTVQILWHVWQRRAEQILQDKGIKCADCF